MPLRQNNLSATFEELAMPLIDRLYNFAYWLTGNREDSEDLVQETFLKGLKGFKSFHPGTNFRAWMYRILRNTFLSARTRSQPEITVPVDSTENGPELAIAAETPETTLIDYSNRELVRNAIDHLPLPAREVILLCDLEELSYRDIAETLAIPIGTVMSRLARARRAIREELRKTVHPIRGGSTQPRAAT